MTKQVFQYMLQAIHVKHYKIDNNILTTGCNQRSDLDVSYVAV